MRDLLALIKRTAKPAAKKKTTAKPKVKHPETPAERSAAAKKGWLTRKAAGKAAAPKKATSATPKKAASPRPATSAA